MESISAEGSPATFATAFRVAIQDRKTTLARLHARLADRGNPVSMATLSYWRSGARRPEGAQSLAAVADLEQLLGLDGGTLLDRLGPTHRTGPIGSTAFPFDEDVTERRVRETFEAMGSPYPDPTRELSTHVVVDVDSAGRIVRRTTRILLQVIAGTISSTPFVEISTGTPIPAPLFTVLAGGRVGALHSHESSEVHGFRLEFERPVTSPDTTLFEWSVTYPPEMPLADGTGHGVAFQSRELMLWVRFDPDGVPRWCEEVEETSNGELIMPREMHGASSVHALRRGFGPGALSIRWGYGEQSAGG